MAELPQVEGHHPVLTCAEAGSHARRAIELDAVPLAVVEGKRVAIEAIAPRQRQTGRRIQSAAQQADSLARGIRLGSFSARKSPAIEGQPLVKTNNKRKGTEQIIEKMIMRRPPKRSARVPPVNPPKAPPSRYADVM